MNDLSMWLDATREDVLRVVQLSPNQLDGTLGDLPGVLASGASITEGYYTDNRTSAKLTVLEAQREPYAWLRLVHECPGYGWSEELGTYVVAQEDTAYQGGTSTTDYDLRSILWAISSDTQPFHFSIGAGATTRQVFERICQTVGKSGRILAGAGDHRYGDSVVYDVGNSYLSDLFDIASTSNNRLDVDGHGRITLGPYTPPSQRDPDWVLDSSTKPIVIDDGIKVEDTTGQATSRVVVTYKSGDTEINAGADVDASSPYSSARRGYTIAETKQATDMSPATQAQADATARSDLALNTSDAGRVRSCKCLYFPVHEGDVVEWREGTSSTKYLVKEADKDLSDWTVSLTLKEV